MALLQALGEKNEKIHSLTRCILVPIDTLPILGTFLMFKKRFGFKKR